MVNRQPTAPPPFTLAEIRKAIPAHCFERSTVRSLLYVAYDVTVISLLFWASLQIQHVQVESALVSLILRGALWILYWVMQGCVMTGLWVLAHECGHGAFSDYTWVNDVVGWVCHSFVLVPYFSWKISHRRHHSNTNNVARDEVFVPPVGKKSEAAEHDHEHEHDMAAWQIKDTFKRAGMIWVMLFLGWPGYLLANLSGRPYNAKWVNHFMPSSPIFSEKERVFIVLSDLGVVLMLGVVLAFVKSYGFAWVACVYGAPYLIVNLFLVLITFLQHTDASLPHYSGEEWDWLRGALASIDRDYGILNYVFHHINDTHVVHHLFSYMPHYHAEEATRAVRKLLGSYYMSDFATPIATSLWRTFGYTHVSADTKTGPEKGVYWLRGPGFPAEPKTVPVKPAGSSRDAA